MGYVELFGDGVFLATKWEGWVGRSSRAAVQAKHHTDVFVQDTASVRLAALWARGVNQMSVARDRVAV